ncbi:MULTISPECIES: hypothetical protein [Burkholderia cepacia complex]|nr:hypothetical protein [Burkholderia cenocepacia]MBJ9922826.1 hypothetical protein [Burkholderia cenocepacia]UJH78835.1 hypothetical protein L0U95_36070 [Burkholderia cenocepacia]
MFDANAYELCVIAVYMGYFAKLLRIDFNTNRAEAFDVMSIGLRDRNGT